MGVYIKGMEMPKGDNWITVRIYSDGTCGRPDAHGDCTLYNGAKAIPVPPHGRLIDADANLAVMRRVLDAPYTRKGKIDTAMLRACISMFEEAPTIMEAEGEER